MLHNHTLVETAHGKNKKNLCEEKFKLSGTTWDENLELRDGSYSVLDVQDFLEYIIKKRRTFTDESQIQIYMNEIQNRITLKTKIGYYLETLTSETMQFSWITEKKIKIKVVKM